MFQVKVIAHSISILGKRLITFELVYPRIIHAELLTHKMLSKNAASSRAIPVPKVIEMVQSTPAMPVRFGANQAGMQDKGEDHDALINGYTPQEWWGLAALSAARFSEEFHLAGYHKQVANRVTEPYQWMKTVMSGTEWENFFWLRDHPAADPTFHKLAHAMYEAAEASEPVLLLPGQWHLPYYKNGYWKGCGYVKSDGAGNIVEIDDKRGGYTLEEAKSISMSCSAQVSYRTLDDTMEKAQRVVERLNLGDDNEDPKHSSPAEHQGTPMKDVENAWPPEEWEEGVTAYHKELGLMSGNFSGWIQQRQLIVGNTKW